MNVTRAYQALLLADALWHAANRDRIEADAAEDAAAYQPFTAPGAVDMVSLVTQVIDTDREGAPCPPYVRYRAEVADPDPGCSCCDHGPYACGLGPGEDAAWDALFAALRDRKGVVEGRGPVPVPAAA